MKSRLAAWTLAAAVLLSRTASAQGDRAHEAERLFREGRTLMDAGDLAHACPKFLESEKLDPAPGTLLSLADCEEREKKLVKAREHFQLAASGFPKNDPRRAFATGRAAAIEKRLAHVTLHLPADAPAETIVRIGDAVVPAASLEKTSMMDPGELHITVSAPGRKDKTETLNLAPGEKRDVVCELGPVDTPQATTTTPATAPVTTMTAPPPEKSDSRRVIAYGLLGVGAASLVVGSVAGFIAVSKASTVEDHCDANYLCDAEGVAAGESGQLMSPLSTITLIAGAVLVGAGAYFYVVSRKTPQGSKSASILLDALQLRGTF